MNLFNPQFLLFLALLLLVAGFLLFYMDMKMREQNHKIKAIADLATTLAQSIKGPITQSTKGGNNNNESNKENIELITVSDDEDDDSSSDDEDDDSSSDDDEDDDSGSDDENDDVHVKQEEPLKLNINISESDIKHVFLSQEPLPEIKEEPLERLEKSELTLLPEEQLLEPVEPVEPISTSELDGFKIVLSSELDYKKMAITKLRQIVTEKGLISPSLDANKMKKPELLKLLEAEAE